MTTRKKKDVEIINSIFTLAEASERYGIRLDTIRNKFKPQRTDEKKVAEWVDNGWVRQSGSTWLVTDKFMKDAFRVFKNVE